MELKGSKLVADGLADRLCRDIPSPQAHFEIAPAFRASSCSQLNLLHRGSHRRSWIILPRLALALLGPHPR
eukprot:187299-Pyramimonas_sp.AAC.1